MEEQCKKTTVFHVRCSNYAGGPETTLLGWLRYIDREKFDPRILFFDEKGGQHHRSLEIFADHCVAVEILPWGPYKNLVGALDALARKVRSAQPAIIHAHDVRSDFVSLIVGRMTRTPVVISNHAWHAIGLKRHLFEACRGFWLRFADMVVNVSQDTDRETRRRGVPEARSQTIYSGLDLFPYRNHPSRTDAKRRLGIDSDRIVVGNVARMWPEKALHTLLDAAGQLVGKHRKLLVVLVGDGILEPELRAQAKRLGIENNVRFLGYRRDLIDVMSAFDLFAFPSLAEGTPMVIYSAMALGLPIVASAVNGIEEVLVDQQSALLIRPADTVALQRALDYLLTDPARANGLGMAAKVRIEETYSAEVSVRAFEKLYAQLLSNPYYGGSCAHPPS